MSDDHKRPKSLGLRLLNFGRNRIRRYTAEDDVPSTSSRNAPPAPWREPVVQRQPEIEPEFASEPEFDAADAAFDDSYEEAQDNAQPKIGRDLLYIMQRHEELRAAQQAAGDAAEAPAPPPSPQTPPVQHKPLASPPPRRGRGVRPPEPPQIARKPASEPQREPQSEVNTAYDMPLLDDDGDTAALYDGDTVRMVRNERNEPPPPAPRAQKNIDALPDINAPKQPLPPAPIRRTPQKPESAPKPRVEAQPNTWDVPESPETPQTPVTHNTPDSRPVQRQPAQPPQSAQPPGSPRPPQREVRRQPAAPAESHETPETSEATDTVQPLQPQSLADALQLSPKDDPDNPQPPNTGAYARPFRSLRRPSVVERTPHQSNPTPKPTPASEPQDFSLPGFDEEMDLATERLDEPDGFDEQNERRVVDPSALTFEELIPPDFPGLIDRVAPQASPAEPDAEPPATPGGKPNVQRAPEPRPQPRDAGEVEARPTQKPSTPAVQRTAAPSVDDAVSQPSSDIASHDETPRPDYQERREHYDRQPQRFPRPQNNVVQRKPPRPPSPPRDMPAEAVPVDTSAELSQMESFEQADEEGNSDETGGEQADLYEALVRAGVVQLRRESPGVQRAVDGETHDHADTPSDAFDDFGDFDVPTAPTPERMERLETVRRALQSPQQKPKPSAPDNVQRDEFDKDLEPDSEPEPEWPQSVPTDLLQLLNLPPDAKVSGWQPSQSSKPDISRSTENSVSSSSMLSPAPSDMLARDLEALNDSTPTPNNANTSSSDDGQHSDDSGADVDKLAREVYRRLRARLRVEQERRTDKS